MSGEVKDGDEEMMKQSEIARRGKQVINSEIAKKVQPLLFHCFYFFQKIQGGKLGAKWSSIITWDNLLHNCFKSIDKGIYLR